MLRIEVNERAKRAICSSKKPLNFIHLKILENFATIAVNTVSESHSKNRKAVQKTVVIRTCQSAIDALRFTLTLASIPNIFVPENYLNV